jgi:broad specificity phosphatase PhoE
MNDGEHKTIAIVAHGGPLRVLFRDILKRGEEIDNIVDCAYVELDKNGETYSIINSEGFTKHF